jgi:tRNA 2-thiouridine synthesizing protein A
MDATITETIDTKGLNCPIPILRAKKALGKLNAADVIEVLATDPAAVKDFEAFCRATGNELMEWSENDGIFRFLIRKTS